MPEEEDSGVAAYRCCQFRVSMPWLWGNEGQSRAYPCSTCCYLADVERCKQRVCTMMQMMMKVRKSTQFCGVASRVLENARLTAKKTFRRAFPPFFRRSILARVNWGCVCTSSNEKSKYLECQQSTISSPTVSCYLLFPHSKSHFPR